MTVSSGLWTGTATTIKFEAPIINISIFVTDYVGLVSGTCLAELTKYAANAMLASKISFMSEMAILAERLGQIVRKCIGADPRIGYHFNYLGCAYGGSCCPKDVKALVHTAQQVGYNAQLLQAVDVINDTQKTTLFSKLAAHFGGEAQLGGKTIAAWGLAFKLMAETPLNLES